MTEKFREGSPGHALVHSGWTFEIETDRTHRDRPVKRYKWTRGLHRSLPTSAAYEVWRDEQWPNWKEEAKEAMRAHWRGLRLVPPSSFETVGEDDELEKGEDSE